MTFRALHAADFGRTPPPGAIRECLVVDDDPVSRVSLARQLAERGLQVRSAGEAAQALDIWQDWRPSAVLIDCVLPDWDGYQLAGAIRALERQCVTRTATLLIAVSGHNDPAHHQRCEVAGMDGVVAKPARMHDYAYWLGLPCDEPGAGNRAAEPVSMAEKHEAELRCLYVSSCECDLQAIFAALAARQAIRARQHAHRIEGASRVLGVATVADAARTLGNAIRDGLETLELSACAATLDRAFRHWQRHHAQATLQGFPAQRPHS